MHQNYDEISVKKIKIKLQEDKEKKNQERYEGGGHAKLPVWLGFLF